LGIGDWGLGIGDWGLGPIPNPQSPIPNPQSPFKFILVISIIINKKIIIYYYIIIKIIKIIYRKNVINPVFKQKTNKKTHRKDIIKLYH
jgi:hypothetical protein